MQTSNRIEILDGFRSLAILSVMFFHFYSRWTPPVVSFNLYPYENHYNYFRYGYLGVQFFFIISGFVIAFTLGNTSGFSEFWKKRWIRLFPGMLVCSLITFTVFLLIDDESIFPQSHSLKNLLFSFTFLSPKLGFHLFNGAQFTYIDGSYWSLWPEIQFYLLASIIYFLNPQKFFTRFFIVSILFYFIHTMIQSFHHSWIAHLLGFHPFVNNYMKTIRIFNLGACILWFLCGVLFFQLYSKNNKKWTLPALIFVILYLLYDQADWQLRMLLLFIFGLFFIFIFFPTYLDFLRHRIFVSIGVASYSLYLIHENIGVLVIHKYGMYLGEFSFLFPLMVIFVFTIFSLVFYKWVERPLGKYFISRFSRSSQNRI